MEDKQSYVFFGPPATGKTVKARQMGCTNQVGRDGYEALANDDMSIVVGEFNSLDGQNLSGFLHRWGGPETVFEEFHRNPDNGED